MAEFQYERRDDFRPFRWPWKKITLCFLVVSLILVGIFFGGYFRGIEVGKMNYKHELHLPVSEKLTRAQWKQEPCSIFSRHCPDGFSEPPTLLISLDGFRPDYINYNVTPSIAQLIKCGAFSKMRPSWPSKTFPNHYTIVTGLYPESHGIVDNKIIDPVTKAMFQIGNNETFREQWWEGEPIWVTAEKQGKRTGTVFWPGSDVRIKGTRPTYFLTYNNKLSWECRVDTILSWLDLPPGVRPSFMTLYVNEPDYAGHKSGPDSDQVKKALRRVDAMISRLMRGLHERNLLGCLNTVITSDHGMTSTSCERVIPLDKYINISTVDYVIGGSSRLRPKNSTEATVNNLINSLRCKEKALLVHHKERLPVRYHYSQNSRIEPVVLDMEPGWLVLKTPPEEDSRTYCNGGAHGYDNMNADMQAIFVATGPAFKQIEGKNTFLNVETYGLLTELLNITALPNNGTYGSLHYFLKNPASISHSISYHLPDMCSSGQVLDENNNVNTGCACDKPVVIDDILDEDTNFNLHLPWGIPKTESEDKSHLCLLKNIDFVSGYHRLLKLPLWTSFTINSFEITHRESVSNCWLADPRIRIEESLTCSSFRERGGNDLHFQSVFPAEFATSEKRTVLSKLLTNVIPRYNFSQTLGIHLNSLIVQYARKFGSVNILTGPAFNNKRKLDNHTLPTHFFTIITFCTQGNGVHLCPPANLDTVSFLLPNEDSPTNCQDTSQYVIYHSASVKDVESCTGLQFYLKLPRYEAIRLRTRLPSES